MNNVTLEVEGNGVTNTLKGWTRLNVTRGIERLPNSFDLQMSDNVPDLDYVDVKVGMTCRVKIGYDVVVTGYIDRFIPSINGNQHIIQVVGRGKCCDLVDCSAVWQSMQFLNVSANEIAVNLCEPFGISVLTEVSTTPISVQNLNLGESPAAVLDRVCKVAQLLYYENEDGDLVLSRERDEKATGSIAQGVNVEVANFTHAMDQRYSKYIVVNPATPVTKDLPGNDASVGMYETEDKLVQRFRPLYILPDDGDAGYVVAQQRMNWELKRRFARSYMLRVTTSTWRDANGDLWRPNIKVNVNIPALKVVNEMWLIGEVTYRLDQTGTHCDMLIMPIGAFTPQPIVGLPADKDVANAYLISQGQVGPLQ